MNMTCLDSLCRDVYSFCDILVVYLCHGMIIRSWLTFFFYYILMMYSRILVFFFCYDIYIFTSIWSLAFFVVDAYWLFPILTLICHLFSSLLRLFVFSSLLYFLFQPPFSTIEIFNRYCIVLCSYSLTKFVDKLIVTSIT